MLIALAIICLVLSVVASIWMLVIIFKRSVIGGLLSLFLGLPVFYFLVKGWGKEGQDIRKPFFLSIILYGIAAGVVFSIMGSAALDFNEELQKQVTTPGAPPARPAPAPRDTPKAEAVRIKDTPAPAATVTPPAPAPIPALAPLPAISEKPVAVAAPKAAAEPVRRAEAPRPVSQKMDAPKPAPSPCVYKAVMTDEDMARCR